MRVLGILIGIIAILAIAAGAAYMAIPAHSLPSFVPGYLAHGTAKHTRRGIAGVALGVILLVISFLMTRAARRHRRRRY
ncbi:MAG TPA: hypothetical protein VEH29_01255 [Acidimicrobiales bacterium]|nr:hypothetical protein [Acidimicrobiales bacterium]